VTSREALARHPLSIAGALIATLSAALFCALTIAILLGWFENPYAGLLVFIAIPALFLMGLAMIPVGMWLQRKRLARDPTEGAEWPVLDFRRPRVRQVTLAVTALTGVNVVILLLAAYGSVHWMESPTFCGQVCHTPMQPQFEAWTVGPHQRVACVSCHVGEGAKGFVHAKLSGVRQLVQVATNSYPRPIPPGAHMPPGAQALTCQNCHDPGRATGDHIRFVHEYGPDEANSETLTILQMHVGQGSSSGRAIHWHANPNVHIEYVATDETNQTIPYVKVTDAKGQVKEYRATDTTDQAIAAGQRHVMDCIDCHNTVGHPIAASAERAVDRAIAVGTVSRALPFARREGVRLLSATYPTHDDAARDIERGLREFYQSRHDSIDQQTLSQTIAGLQAIYRHNVFPAMKVTWGSYPDNRGHMTSTGCFRCHDDSHKAPDGTTISADCEHCHKQIEPRQ